MSQFQNSSAHYHITKAPTSKEIATQLGVSPATVSRVLNNRPGVSDSIREKVLQAVASHTAKGSFSLSPACTDADKANNCIALITGETTNYFFAELSRSIAEYAENFGFCVSIFCAKSQSCMFNNYLHRLQKDAFAGVIFAAIPEGNPEFLSVIDEPSIPYVLCNREMSKSTGPYNYVAYDNFSGIRIVLKYLQSLGHRRVALMRGPTDIVLANTHRTDFYEHGMDTDERMNVYVDYRPESATAATLSLMKLANRPTAIICVSEIMALGVLDALHTLGLRVPDDCSVISFGNTYLASQSNIQLTCVDNAAQPLASLCVDAIIQQIHGNTVPISTLLPPQLIIRNTTGPVPQG